MEIKSYIKIIFKEILRVVIITRFIRAEKGN